MSIIQLVQQKQKVGAFVVLLICILLSATSIITASIVQRDFGGVEVSDVYFKNINGVMVRAKLFVPDGATRGNPMPGMVYIHGYQNNRETGDAYSIETARRGIVVLNIDAIGRGHSGLPGEPSDPGFDPTYGGKSAVAFLKSLPYVRLDAVGIMGHSLGAEMAYRVALDDPTLAATVITGYGYTAEATPAMPRNMLMIIGQYDEFRGRMTGTRNIEKEWMASQRTEGIMLSDLGVSFFDAGFHLDGRALVKAFIQRLPSSIILRKEMPFRRFLSRKLFNSEIFLEGEKCTVKRLPIQ